MATASLISRLSQAVDLIEQRSQQNRPLKIINVRCGFDEDRNVAKARHYAAHPEDRGANVVIFSFAMMRKWPTRAGIASPAGPRRITPA